MSLFDVVYLDLMHDFQIPLDILSIFVDKEKSQTARSKLAAAYCLQSKSALPFHKELTIQKARLMFESVIHFWNNFIIYGSYLVSINKFRRAEEVLSTLVLDENAEFNIFNSVSIIFPFQKQKTEIQELQLLMKQENPIYLSSRVFASYLLIKCHIALQTPIDIDKSLSEMRWLCASLESDKQYLNLHLLQQLCSDLRKEKLAQRANGEIFTRKMQLIHKCNSQQLDIPNDARARANRDCLTGTLLYFQMAITTLFMVGLDQRLCNPQSRIYKHLDVLITKFNALDLSKSSTAQGNELSSSFGKCPHVLAGLVVSCDALFNIAKFFFLEKAATFRKLAYTDFERIIQIGLQVLDRVKFSGSYMMKFVFLMMNTVWSNKHTWEFALILDCFKLVEWLALKHHPTSTNKTYFAQFLVKVKTAKRAVPILEDVIKVESRSPVSILIWPQELKTWLDVFIQKQMNKTGRDCLVLPTIVYACYLLSKIYYALGQSDDYERIMRQFHSSCETLGKIFQ